MRGLKRSRSFGIFRHAYVASFTDAWIETGVGRQNILHNAQSHLLQMRGLKQAYLKHRNERLRSHLLQMRGLKLILILF